MKKPGKQKTSVTLVIPAFNEANRIENSLKKIYDFHRQLPYHLQCIVVNDGSRDRTAEIVTDFAATHPWLKLITSENNQGKGHGVKTGMMAADSEFIFFTDADLAADPANITRALPKLRTADIVIGSRRHPASVIMQQQPWFRRLPARLGNRLIRLKTGLPFPDTQCGFKGFTQTAGQKIFPRLTLNGYLFDVEILTLARQMGLIVKEMPILWSHIPEGSFRILPGFSGALKDLATFKKPSAPGN